MGLNKIIGIQFHSCSHLTSETFGNGWTDALVKKMESLFFAEDAVHGLYYPLLPISHMERVGVTFPGPVNFPGDLFNGSQSVAFPEQYLALNDPMAMHPGLAVTNEASFMNRCGQFGVHNGPMMAPGDPVLQGHLQSARPFCRPGCALSGPALPSAVMAPSRSMISVLGPVTPHLIWPNNAPMLSGPLCTPHAAMTRHPPTEHTVTYPVFQMAATSGMTASSGPVQSTPREVLIHCQPLQGLMDPLPLLKKRVGNQINTSPGGSAHLPKYRRRAREQEQDNQGSPNKPAKRRSEFEPPQNPDTMTLVLNLNNTLESGPFPQQTQDSVHVVSVSVNIDTTPPNIPSPQ
ncbi:uncharacterized protein LOC128759579 [Synchiropus splendidus]|uniref:uncharacterized protein LOC128759579 n=1 Tax=Synchiropus splendidus TaxID=270530 RepID=UPI00237D559D|nr:uncharacterized protein LOC128759579 [Synchiropus splendidus]